MPKPDPILLEPGRYPTHYDLEPRFQDLDPNRHINNVAMTAFFEDARVRLDRDMKRDCQSDTMLLTMIASLHIEFLGETFYPDPVRVHVGYLTVGRSSWTIGALARQNGRDTAFSRAVLVNLADGRPAPIPTHFREAMAEFMIDGAA